MGLLSPEDIHVVSRVKAWLLRWLGIVPISEVQSLRANLDALSCELEKLTLEWRAAVGEVISELNLMRNSIPAASEATHRPVRVFRNFREFKSVVEGKPQQPIRIERTS